MGKQGIMTNKHQSPLRLLWLMGFVSIDDVQLTTSWNHEPHDQPAGAPCRRCFCCCTRLRFTLGFRLGQQFLPNCSWLEPGDGSASAGYLRNDWANDWARLIWGIVMVIETIVGIVMVVDVLILEPWFSSTWIGIITHLFPKVSWKNDEPNYGSLGSITMFVHNYEISRSMKDP